MSNLSRHFDRMQVCALASAGSIIDASFSAYGKSVAGCHGHVPKIVAVIRIFTNLIPCNIGLPNPNRLYGVWVSLSLFDAGKSFI